jgi:hypothetical protein
MGFAMGFGSAATVPSFGRLFAFLPADSPFAAAGATSAAEEESTASLRFTLVEAAAGADICHRRGYAQVAAARRWSTRWREKRRISALMAVSTQHASSKRKRSGGSEDPLTGGRRDMNKEMERKDRRRSAKGELEETSNDHHNNEKKHKAPAQLVLCLLLLPCSSSCSSSCFDSFPPFAR